MFEIHRIVYGVIFSSIIGGIAYWRRSLSASGWLGAVLTGTATFGFGGLVWGLLLVIFFTTSSLLSRYKEPIKTLRANEKFEKGGRRDFGQVMANGGVASVLALFYALLHQPAALYFAYIGVIATVTADTWATELGVLSKQRPFLITTWQPTEAGTSGGITLFGTTAAMIGGLTIGCAAMLFGSFARYVGEPMPCIWIMPLIGLVGGLAGACFDSFLGATVQTMYADVTGNITERPTSANNRAHKHVRGWSWLNNDAVNLISSLFGGLVAFTLMQILL